MDLVLILIIGTVDIPAGRIGPVHIHVSSNAKWYQRVTIKDNQECGYNQTFTGTGEGNVLGEVERVRILQKYIDIQHFLACVTLIVIISLHIYLVFHTIKFIALTSNWNFRIAIRQRVMK
eukprot:Phypoly_transcript_17023.p2 GENE.Phypoly_transcript_17023~~Phypoly_transcript_17023.p2  ORF type:complete len:120 (+),score=2.09 Phypoly_transcript_17023:177-536(+)